MPTSTKTAKAAQPQRARGRRTRNRPISEFGALNSQPSPSGWRNELTVRDRFTRVRINNGGDPAGSESFCKTTMRFAKTGKASLAQSTSPISKRGAKDGTTTRKQRIDISGARLGSIRQSVMPEADEQRSTLVPGPAESSFLSRRFD